MLQDTSIGNNICKQGQSAGLVSVIFKPEYDMEAIRRFCDALQLFKLGFSWVDQ